MYQLDELDEAIIEALQEDGRTSLASIAARVRLSPDAVRNRIARLTNDAILKVVGVVDPRSVGLNAQAAVGISYEGDLKTITQELALYGEVTFMAVMLGHKNIMCEISTADDNGIADFVAGTIAPMEGVNSVEVWKHLSVHKWETGIRRTYGNPVVKPSDPEGGLDKLDVQLLRLLTDNPRRSYADLAEAVGAPYSVVRRRCQALFDRGTIRAEVVVNRVSTQTLTMALLGIRIYGSDIDSVLAGVAHIAEVEILLRVSGAFAAIAEVGCASIDDLHRVDDLIRSVPGVAMTEIFPYVRIEKLPAEWAFQRRGVPGQSIHDGPEESTD